MHQPVTTFEKKMSDSEHESEEKATELIETPTDIVSRNYKKELQKELIKTEYAWVQHGKKVDKNARKTYSSMLVSDDSGQLRMSQIVLPGGKKKELSKDLKLELNKENITVGNLTDDNLLVTVESRAWWHEKGQSDFAAEGMKNVENLSILIMDNLGLHRQENFHKSLQRSNVLPILGGARITGVGQVNDRLLNGLVDIGIKTMSFKHF